MFDECSHMTRPHACSKTHCSHLDAGNCRSIIRVDFRDRTGVIRLLASWSSFLCRLLQTYRCTCLACGEFAHPALPRESNASPHSSPLLFAETQRCRIGKSTPPAAWRSLPLIPPPHPDLPAPSRCQDRGAPVQSWRSKDTKQISPSRARCRACRQLCRRDLPPGPPVRGGRPQARADGRLQRTVTSSALARQTNTCRYELNSARSLAGALSVRVYMCYLPHAANQCVVVVISHCCSCNSTAGQHLSWR